MKANEIIKARRTDLGMTQKELAVKVGVTEANILTYTAVVPNIIPNNKKRADRSPPISMKNVRAC